MNFNSRISRSSVLLQQHSGVGVHQGKFFYLSFKIVPNNFFKNFCQLQKVMNPVIRETVRPIPIMNQIGILEKKKSCFGCSSGYESDVSEEDELDLYYDS